MAGLQATDADIQRNRIGGEIVIMHCEKIYKGWGSAMADSWSRVGNVEAHRFP